MLICGTIFLTSCSRVTADSAPVEQSAMSGNTWVSEAYTGIEDPRLRGQGTPAYWPPLSEQSGGGEFTQVASPYAVTSVTLDPVTYGTQQLFKLEGSDYLIARPDEEIENNKIAVANRAKELLALKQQNPEVRFYTYFINRATNCNWYGSTEGIFAYDYAAYFQSQLGGGSGIACGEFTLTNLQDYMDTGYKLDFHLNHIGAYRAYQSIYAMLAKNMDMTPILTPVREVDYDNLRTIGQTIKDPDNAEIPEENMDIFKTYQFNYGDFTSYVNDKKMTIGMEEEYGKGQFSRAPAFQHLFSFYGGQTGVIRFEFHQPDRPNLLILSDSQGRPIRKLLASHFNRTIYLDDVQTNSLDLDQVIADNEIDVVVFVGQVSLFERFSGTGT